MSASLMLSWTSAVSDFASATLFMVLAPVWLGWQTSAAGRRADLVQADGLGPLGARGLDQSGEALAGVEHAGLDRVLGDGEEVGDLLDRLLLVVDEVDDLTVLGRQRREAAAQDHPALAVEERLVLVRVRVGDADRRGAIERLV